MKDLRGLTRILVLVAILGGTSATVQFEESGCRIKNVKESIVPLTTIYEAAATHSAGHPIDFELENTDAFAIIGKTKQKTVMKQGKLVVLNTASIATHRKLDYEKDNKLTFSIKAVSRFDASQVAILVCTVILTDVNDNVPQFDQMTYFATVKENPPNGHVVFKEIKVTDLDLANDVITVTCVKTPKSITDLKPGLKHPCDVFEIVTISRSNKHWHGRVIVKDGSALDYERFVSKSATGAALTNLYLIPAVAFDGTNKNTESLVVEIEDIQDKGPVLQSVSLSFKETIAPGTHITDLIARDGDVGVPRKLCYHMIPPAGRASYLAVPNDRKPTVTAAVELDREKTGGTITEEFRVSELIPETNKCSTKPSEQAVGFIKIDIIDVNDNAPYFVPERKTFTVSERAAINLAIPGSLFKSYDIDTGDNAKYTVALLAHTDIFRVTDTDVLKQGTHIIELKKKLDYDDPVNTPLKRFIVPVIAIEKTPERKSGTATLTIELTDINDNTPVFPKDRYRVEIPEDTPPFKPVITITASDKDSGVFGKDGIVYELIGTGTDKFKIDPKTGLVTVADCRPDKPGEGRCLDYEATKSYTLSVVARDNNGNGNQKHTELVIIILDVNDNVPSCVRGKYESSMLETSVKPDPPLIIKATDKDSKRNSNNVITYSIIAGDPNGNFMINSNGEITAKGLIDYETHGQKNNGKFTMTIQVKDPKFKNTCTAVVNLLDVNDNTPTFDKNQYEMKIPETTPPGTKLLTVKATDRDLATSPNGQINYRIEDGSEGKFAIDQIGLITVAPQAKFDYDVNNRYIMHVAATDKGFPGRTGTTTVTIHILDRNNKAPTLIPNTVRESIWENETIGYCVTKLTATDPDSNASLVYDFIVPNMKAYLAGRIPVDSKKYDFTTIFKLDRKTGLVCTQKSLDYEKAAEFELPVRVTDVNAPTLQTGTGTLYVRVMDINEHDPVFIDTQNLTFPHYNTSINEELPLNSFVRTMVATDVDSSTISAYKLISDGNGFFAIQEKTGVVTIKKRVDYEKIRDTKLVFTVMAYDVGVPIRSASATVFVEVINMNDMIPQFNESEYKATIYEHSPEGTYVATVKATDLDVGDYGVVRFNMTDKRFKVDKITGVITVAKGAVLDREKTPIINVKVEASDSPLKAEGRNFNYVPVVITLLDINDHPPKFDSQNYYAQITENTPVTTSVLQLRATDGDHTCNCINAKIMYTKIKGTGDNKDFFYVKPESGLITVNSSLIGSAGLYKFRVLARDGYGSGKFSVSASVTISVIDANNKPPEFIRPSSRNQTISVLENQYRGLLVYRVRAIDPDGDLNSPITYGFRVNNKMVDRTAEFRINNITGQIRAERVFDREEIDKYLLHVSAADHGVPSFVTTIDLIVLILDVDDNLPEFVRPNYQFSVPEDVKADYLVGVIEATDKDTVASTSIKYSIVSGNIKSSFKIKVNKNKAEIYTNKILDREDRDYYELLVRASNTATGFNLNTRKKRATQDASATRVMITVVDVNDNTPQFVLPDYRACAAVDAPFSKAILEVKANDKDTGEAGKVFYKLRNIKNIREDGQSRERLNAFTISTRNGTIYTNALLNQDGKSYFDMQVVGYNNDSTKTEGTSNARVYVTQSSTRVKVSIKRSPDEVNRYIKDYKRVIAESLNSKVVCVEATRYHINQDNIIEVDKADLIVHVVDMDQNAIFSASDVVKEMTDASKGRLLSDYRVLFIFDINRVEVEETEITLHPVFIIMCIIAVILIIALILLGLICFFLNRQYKKEMRKAKYATEGPVPMVTTPGGTVNPLWKERMDVKGYTEDMRDIPGRDPELPAM